MKKEVKYIVVMVSFLVVVLVCSFTAREIIHNRNEKKADNNVYRNVDYSLVYDYDYYKNKYEEVTQKCKGDKYEMLSYFVEYGMKEGQQACADFDVISYRNEYKDLRQIFGEDLTKYYQHYMEFGYNEGRIAQGVEYAYEEEDYSLVYNYDYYIDKYPDIYNQYNGDRNRILEYFVDYGMAQGQQGIESFNVYVYKEKYKDLRETYGDNLELYYQHYIQFGYNEGRTADN